MASLGLTFIPNDYFQNTEDLFKLNLKSLYYLQFIIQLIQTMGDRPRYLWNMYVQSTFCYMLCNLLIYVQCSEKGQYSTRIKQYTVLTCVMDTYVGNIRHNPYYKYPWGETLSLFSITSRILRNHFPNTPYNTYLCLYIYGYSQSFHWNFLSARKLLEILDFPAEILHGTNFILSEISGGKFPADIL